jgi:hypothetical protein
MDRDQALDFEQQMYWAVAEEASLAELPLGGTDYVGDGRKIEHGPWDPAACSAHLLAWFDDGLIDLYDTRKGHPANRPDHLGPLETRNGPAGTLPASDTRNRLAQWQRWGDGDDLWRCTRLVLTDTGVRKLVEPDGRQSPAP